MADPLGIRCPARTCRAEPGEPCLTSTGITRAETHHLRWLATHRAVTKCCPDGCDRCQWTTFRPLDGQALTDEVERLREENTRLRNALIDWTIEQYILDSGEPQP
jgi:hypothetical protein